jgi:hypothetical protein
VPRPRTSAHRTASMECRWVTPQLSDKRLTDPLAGRPAERRTPPPAIGLTSLLCQGTFAPHRRVSRAGPPRAQRGHFSRVSIMTPATPVAVKLANIRGQYSRAKSDLFYWAPRPFRGSPVHPRVYPDVPVNTSTKVVVESSRVYFAILSK